MKNKVNFIWTGLVAAVLLQGMPLDATLIAYDGFDTSVAGDAANGIYQSGAAFTSSVNNAVSGGNMVGFSNSKLWTPSNTSDPSMTPINNTGNLGISTTTVSLGVRHGLGTSLSGKTVTYLSALIRMDMADAAGTASAFVSTGSSTGNASRGGGFGFYWNTDTGSWDLKTRRYDSTAGFQNDLVAADVATVDTGWQYVVLRVDEANNTMSVWVNPVDTNAAATMSVSDYLGTVSDIGSIVLISSKLNGTGSGFSFDEVKLGDTMSDVWTVVPEPTTLSLFSIATASLMLVRKVILKTND